MRKWIVMPWDNGGEAEFDNEVAAQMYATEIGGDIRKLVSTEEYVARKSVPELILTALVDYELRLVTDDRTVKKIQLIKSYRQVTNLDLRTAKDHVETEISRQSTK